MSAPSATPPANEKVLEGARRFLSELLRRVDPLARLELTPRGGGLEVSLREAGAFQGREGVAIQALEHLTDLVLRRTLHSQVRVRVDIDGFRQRRLQELQDQARELARQALSARKPVHMEPMTAWERKAVHQALEGVAGIKTYSRGRLERHLVIEPLPPKPSR